MANYFLSIEKKRGTYEEIDWNLLNDNSFGKKSLTLESVDKFTTSFEDEDALKEKLIMTGLLKLDDYNKRLTIRYRSNGEMKNLTYGLLFAGDKKFLDPSYIVFYLKSKKEDTAFLEKLCNHYRQSYIQGININAIREYVNKLNMGAIPFQEEVSYVDKCLYNFVIKECYNYDSYTHKYKVDASGNPSIKYKGLHDLGAFLAYDAKAKQKMVAKTETTVKLEEKPVTLEKPKVLVKTNHQISIDEYLKEKKNQE